MTQFREGQDVEVRSITQKNEVIWDKAKIHSHRYLEPEEETYYVELPDGSRAVFDVADIREICPICAAGGGVVG